MPRALLSPPGRLLNHTELVYRPGARERVAGVFEALGCATLETGGPFLVIRVDPAAESLFDNVLYASEVTPEQWRFEQALEDAAGDEALRDAKSAYVEHLRKEPQRSAHFGIRLGSEKELEDVLARVDAHPDVALAGLFRPGERGALSDSLVQAFVKTDLCAAGLVTLGQHIELQVDLSAAAAAGAGTP